MDRCLLVSLRSRPPFEMIVMTECHIEVELSDNRILNVCEQENFYVFQDQRRTAE